MLQADPLSNVGIESSHSKLYGTTRCWDTLYDAQQTAGGAGFLSTLPYEKRLRDFRVTTIFEGTTEIHSIYPPLTLARAYGKELAAQGTAGKACGALRLAGTRALRRARETQPVLKAALRTATRSEALFRSLLSVGSSQVREQDRHPGVPPQAHDAPESFPLLAGGLGVVPEAPSSAGGLSTGGSFGDRLPDGGGTGAPGARRHGGRAAARKSCTGRSSGQSE